MKRQVNLDGASYKEWISLPAAFVFWIASLICFIFGLAFKTGGGIYLPGIPVNLELLFSLGLGFANTAIQIVGNDTDREDLGMALWLMWIASYMLGIGSNVNFLYQKIGLDSQILQFLVCWGLGVMIEVAPERLLVKFLRAIGVFGKPQTPQTNRVPNNLTQNQSQYTQPTNNMGQGREQRHEQMRQQGSRGQEQASQQNPQHHEGPTYHPIRPVSNSTDLPPFLSQQFQQGRKNGNVRK